MDDNLKIKYFISQIHNIIILFNDVNLKGSFEAPIFTLIYICNEILSLTNFEFQLKSNDRQYPNKYHFKLKLFVTSIF